MTINYDDSHMMSIAQLEEFIKVSKEIKFKGVSRDGKYKWIEKVLNRFRYFSLQKKDKSIVKQYIMKMTGYSDAQLTRLILKKKKCGRIRADTTRRHKFPRKYTPSDVARLIETDKAHDRLSGPATKRIFNREYKEFGKKEYERIAGISNSHIYNLRSRRQYTSNTQFFQKTKPTPSNIGVRRKPDPQGKPGYIRVDTVHQGDLDKQKGVYHINMVDEVTQWEIVGCVEKVSEHHLKPLLESLIAQFPFTIINFHSDNGSEYINKVVAKLLNKLLIGQTKSRARHSHDNALVEGKNGSVIRKHMGYMHIPGRYAQAITVFYQNHLNIYLNYHRPCGFATTITDKRGKEKKVYKDYLTPYEGFKSLKNAEQYLKDGVTFEMLDKIAYEKSDNEFAASMQKAKVELFKSFSHKSQFPTIYTTFISGSYVD